MRCVIAMAVGAAVALSGPAWAMDCSDMRPTPSQNTDVSGSGKLEAGVDGLFKRLANPHADIDGNYRKIKSDVLPQFPNADRVFIWERVLFLECQALNEDTSMLTKDKLEYFSRLLAMYNQPPPPLTPTAASNVLSNSGNNVNAVQGNGNSVNIGGSRP